jgi:hypothetical protein
VKKKGGEKEKRPKSISILKVQKSSRGEYKRNEEDYFAIPQQITTFSMVWSGLLLHLYIDAIVKRDTSGSHICTS